MCERHRAFAGTPELHERHRPRLFAHAYSAISCRIRTRCCCRCYPRRRFVLVFLVLVVVRALSFHICHENVLCRMRFVFRRQRRRVFFSRISFFSSSFSFFFAFFSFSIFIRPNPLLCRLFIIIIVSYLYYISLLLLMLLLLMDCGVFLCKMKFYAFFQN